MAAPEIGAAIFYFDTARSNTASRQAARPVIPENRLRVHEVRDVIGTLADEGSVLELRRVRSVTRLTRSDDTFRP